MFLPQQQYVQPYPGWNSYATAMNSSPNQDMPAMSLPTQQHTQPIPGWDPYATAMNPASNQGTPAMFLPPQQYVQPSPGWYPYGSAMSNLDPRTSAPINTHGLMPGHDFSQQYPPNTGLNASCPLPPSTMMALSAVAQAQDLPSPALTPSLPPEPQDQEMTPAPSTTDTLPQHTTGPVRVGQYIYRVAPYPFRGVLRKSESSKKVRSTLRTGAFARIRERMRPSESSIPTDPPRNRLKLVIGEPYSINIPRDRPPAAERMKKYRSTLRSGLFKRIEERMRPSKPLLPTDSAQTATSISTDDAGLGKNQYNSQQPSLVLQRPHSVPIDASPVAQQPRPVVHPASVEDVVDIEMHTLEDLRRDWIDRIDRINNCPAEWIFPEEWSRSHAAVQEAVRDSIDAGLVFLRELEKVP